MLVTKRKELTIESMVTVKYSKENSILGEVSY